MKLFLTLCWLGGLLFFSVCLTEETNRHRTAIDQFETSLEPFLTHQTQVLEKSLLLFQSFQQTLDTHNQCFHSDLQLRDWQVMP